jgi:hypothetical protein
MFGSVQGKRRTMRSRLPDKASAPRANRRLNCCDANQLSELESFGSTPPNGAKRWLGEAGKNSPGGKNVPLRAGRICQRA